MSKIRMVVSDLDGTLLDGNRPLSDRIVKRVREFTETGGLFTVATGRNWLTTKEIAEKLSIRLPMILCNGAVLADDKEIYYQSEIPAGRMKSLFLKARQAGLSILLFEHKKVYGFGNGAGLRRFSEKEKMPCETVEADGAFLERRRILKVVLIGPFDISASLWEKHEAELAGEYDFFQSESDFFEIVKRGENKGKTMLKLADRMGVSREEILAVGNHMNDREMICMAGVGAAVSDSSPELKPFADFVCRNSSEEGVIEALDRFCR